MADVHYESIFFTGRVQGVGFRFAALQVAREFDVAGHVANLPDGRVQLEIEGTPEIVDEFVAALEARMHGHIRRTERTAGKRSRQFTGFVIR